MAVMTNPQGGPPRGRRSERKTKADAHLHGPGPQDPDCYEPERRKLDLEKWIIPASAVVTGILTGLAAPSILSADSILDWLKVGLLGGAAMFVSGVVNHYAIRYGAEFSGRGFRIAPLISLVPVVAVGFGAATFSYSGLVLDKVDRSARQTHGTELRGYAEAVNAHALQAIQLKPVVEATAADLARNLLMEEQQGTLSGGKAGRGSVYRIVLPLADRASTIAGQMEEADRLREEHLARTNHLLDHYAAVLSGAEPSKAQHTEALMRASGEVKAGIQALRQTLPLAFLEAYGQELNQGVSISTKPEATHRVNTMLQRNGSSLQAALDGIKADITTPPVFPSEAGVAEAMEQMGRFWPIALLTYSIELTIPVVMWLWAYLGTVWQIYKARHPIAPGSQISRPAPEGGRDNV